MHFCFLYPGLAGTASDKIFLEDSRIALATSLAGVWVIIHLPSTEPGFPHTDGFADAKRGHYCHDPWLDVFERVCDSTNFYCGGGDITGILVMKLDSLSFEIKEWSAILWAFSAAFGFALMQVLEKSIIHEIHPQVLNVFRLAIGLALLWCVEEVRIEIPALNISGWIGSNGCLLGPFWGRVAFIILYDTLLFPRQISLFLLHLL
ncbi:MAG: hypothetical protein CM1200mP30_10420 [Pseudomonadota bacterium]|nr:MAG: hypothetical protein CM1200mP30_10420 [Pseudomonadota bacterium]